MSKHLNPVVKNLPPSGIRKFFDLVISAGPDVVSLGVGEPDFPTPWHIRESVIFALENGFTSYSENSGLLELREEIAKYHLKDSPKKYNPANEVLVTNGVSEGMDLVFRAILKPGEKILIPDPGYVMYDPLVKLAGGVCELYNPTKINEINISENTKGIVINSPGNPIGNCLSENDVKHISALAEKHDFLILSDEIYAELSFETPHFSFAKYSPDRTILFSGLSKGHAMTGFRIGWACGNSDVIGAMTKIHQYSALCAPTPSQIGAIEALRRGDPEVQKMKEIYNERRLFCIKRLKEIGIETHIPKGAFYIFANISPAGMDDITFCEKLLEENKLAIVPGLAFGKNGKGYVRMTYAENIEKLTLAFDRLEKFWKSRT